MALVAFGWRLYLASHGPGDDFRMVWNSLHSLLYDRQPYHNPYFPYPPSALLLLGLLGAVPFSTAHHIFLLVDAAAIVLAGALCLALFELDWRSPSGAGMLIVLALYAPVTQTLNAGNVNGLVFAAQAAMLLAIARQRWASAGLCLGVSLAVKPILLPLVLLFALFRRWDAVALAFVPPVVLSAPVMLFIGDASLYLHRIVPCPGRSSENVALTGAAAFLGLPDGVSAVVRVSIAAVSALIGVALWRRRSGDLAVDLVELSGWILASAFLLSCYAWPYYALYLLPTFLSVIRRNSAMRHWFALFALYGLGAPDIRLWLLAGPVGAMLVHLRITTGLGFMLGALGVAAWQRHTGKIPRAAPGRVL